MAAAAPLRLLAELCQWEAVKGDDSQRSRVEIPALCSHCETGGKDSSPERQASSLWNGARAALTLSAASMPQSTSHRPQEAWSILACTPTLKWDSHSSEAQAHPPLSLQAGLPVLSSSPWGAFYVFCFCLFCLGFSLL